MRPALSKDWRTASSVMRGSAMTLRSPVAKTPPSSELAASLLTTSLPGRLLRVTPSTSSSRLAGAIWLERRLTSLSMMIVSAAMEHRISGQMGQPAACMIESKTSSELLGGATPRDYDRTPLARIAGIGGRSQGICRVIHRCCG